MIDPVQILVRERRTWIVSFQDKLAVGDGIIPTVTVVPDPGLSAAVLGHDASSVSVRVGSDTPGVYDALISAPTGLGDVLEHTLRLEVLGDGDW